TVLVLLLAGHARAQSQLAFPGPAPGKAGDKVRRGELVLENKVLSFTWDISQRKLKPKRVTDKITGNVLDLQDAECFQLVLDDGRIVKASGLRRIGAPEIRNMEPYLKSYRLAEHLAGRQITVLLASSDENIEVRWRGILRDGSNYIRQQITVTAKNEPLKIKEIVLWELLAANAEIKGIVDGSPVVAGNMFFAYENPLSKCQLQEADTPSIRCGLPRYASLEPGVLQTHSSVVGVVPQGQLRRGFLYYVERERAHPYRPFLHYNSWYDIGYGPEKIQPEQFAEVIELFGRELTEKRRVRISSFVPDDGWDDPTTLWRFHEGFPDGFAPLRPVVEKYNSVLGVWLSPFGGYGKAKQERLKYGRQQGFETNKNGFSLAGPRYFGRFRDACVKMINNYDLNYFKFDGIGVMNRPTGTVPEFARDMEALLKLMSELRRVKPDVFINTTTGTWSSPYWLWYCDSTWRSGRDWGKHGAGTDRQQQVTYRDKETYHNVVKRGPLYPLNSLMTQGVMIANHGLPNATEGLVADIRDFFASGTNCQELYITPSMMGPKHWDALAEAAKWSHDNSDVLVDTHWVGGDPAAGQIYGWASWAGRKGILALRNPGDAPSAITIDIGEAFELPADAARKYSLRSPWKENAGSKAIVLTAGKEHTFRIEPFEVLVFDATPL
ncbi:MAG: enterotoxin, partial [Planctomycetota bacterium]|nr:enterotoxin [Planctomycetota bacterium]